MHARDAPHAVALTRPWRRWLACGGLAFHLHPLPNHDAQLVNNYDKEVFNGDHGRVRAKPRVAGGPWRDRAAPPAADDTPSARSPGQAPLPHRRALPSSTSMPPQVTACYPSERRLVVHYPHLDKGGADGGVREYQASAAPPFPWCCAPVSCHVLSPCTPFLHHCAHHTCVSVRLPRAALQGVELAQLELAYAITVHKAQGGEAAHVVLALSPVHGRMLTRRLLYTGALLQGLPGPVAEGKSFSELQCLNAETDATLPPCAVFSAAAPDPPHPLHARPLPGSQA